MRSLLLLAALAAFLASCQAIDPRVCTMPHPPNDPNWARIFNITNGRIDDKYAESVIMRSLAKITGQFKAKKVIGKLCRIDSWQAVEACFNPNKKSDKAWPTAGNYGLRAYVTYKCKGAHGKTVKKGFEVWPSPDVVVAKLKGKKIQKILRKFPWDYMPYPGGHQIITGSN